ncbi:PAS domain S-box protein [Thalassotalea sp. LPB0316]|uniref:methyl-accepting chemotaxis protein n=1 Tax=Thalassotalea sp. LPB0316 TaxID=2769490 RepID=UPI0018692CAE|nr:methyl-accepting chemotaxis protein [Thalassotalea sp. LPB0316]QOL25602.1 PAS domain S-box protein [Thalassotalea sp. LPB0316]
MSANFNYIDEEVHFPAEQQLISTTDLVGKITYVNSNFCKIAGYSKDELIGQHHNIVRHKDMPKVAFEDLWSKLKAYKPWMGLVKNRTKCGRYYWVNAFVTPIYEAGRVIGYQSVRTKPTRDDIERAMRIYSAKNLTVKRFNITNLFAELSRNSLVNYLSGALAAISVTAFEQPAIAAGLSVIPLVGLYTQFRANKLLKAVNKQCRAIFDSPVIATTYSDLPGAYANIETTLKFLESKAVTILGRVNYTSGLIAQNIETIKDVTKDVANGTYEQQSQVDQIATAMEEMVTTVQDIARNTLETSNHTNKASEISDSCCSSINTTKEALEALAGKVTHAADSAQQLNTQAANIEKVVTVIRLITEQTGLLALNAAIEAARAGEQGRGFAVVADEVRALASKTSESTKEIEQTISEIQLNIAQWAENMNDSRSDAQLNVEKMVENEQLVFQQQHIMSEVLGQSIQVSSATEEQEVVASEINRNIHHINDIAQANTQHTEVLKASVDKLQGISNEMNSLVRSFSH